MKKNYTILIKLFMALLICPLANAQGIETFDNESGGSTTFSENGMIFNITSSTSEVYDVFEHGYHNSVTEPNNSDSCIGCGWSGNGIDQKFVDLTGVGNNNGNGNGSSFTISTADGSDITIKSLYLFCATSSFTAHSGTLTITGKKDGNVTPVFSFVFSGTFASPTTLTPNNGFTLIDMSSVDIVDYSTTNVDEVTFTSTGNLDYMALDTFIWGASVLSTNDFELINKPSIYPIPSENTITISNIDAATDFSIIDILGKTLTTGSINNNETINIASLTKGIYFLKLDDAQVMRFIKQ
ncbi:T9SS type A sorting domain-containing protein [Winogradskyella sp.]|uniref:T9SS type A sorting domain-containing protein n=1 Tax=Winogradskyella sp. TaxID=1883156 RepID=UPI0025E9596B|nr:T9SS type A sorting domain-containing protein [Winogradskyella sp.]